MHILVGLVLIISPFLLGLNSPLAWSSLAVVLLLALQREPPVATARHPQHKTALRVLLAIAALFALALPLLQLAGGPCGELPARSPCTTNPEASWLSLAFVTALSCWFLLLTGAARPATNRLLMAITLAGAIQALYALLAFFLGYTPLLLGNVFHHDTVPTGGFPNRNHFAAFLYVAIFAAIALVLRLPADIGSGRAARWRLLLDQRLLWRLAIVLMVLALIATRSRAGNACFLLGLLAGFAWLLLVERRRLLPASTHRQPAGWKFITLVIASVLVLDALLLGSFVGLEKVQQRIADTSLEGEQRGVVNTVLLAHQELFTATGHGAGSFLAVFERVKPGNLPLLYKHAHNDYLQVLVERGWIGALLFASALLLSLWLALGRGLSHRGAECRFALVAATTALLAHASVEYVTQVPALWLMWLALLAQALHYARYPHARPARAVGGDQFREFA